MRCSVYTVDGPKVYENLVSITLPGTRGDLEILPGHAETFIKMNSGQIIFRSPNDSRTEESSPQSICYVDNDEISIIV